MFYVNTKLPYEQLPALVTEKRPMKGHFRGWRHLRDSRRNLVLRSLEISAANLHETLEANAKLLTPEFCEKIFEQFKSHAAWSDPSLCFKILSSLRTFRDYQDSAFFKALELHMATKLGFA